MLLLSLPHLDLVEHICVLFDDVPLTLLFQLRGRLLHQETNVRIDATLVVMCIVGGLALSSTNQVCA